MERVDGQCRMLFVQKSAAKMGGYFRAALMASLLQVDFRRRLAPRSRHTPLTLLSSKESKFTENMEKRRKEKSSRSKSLMWPPTLAYSQTSDFFLALYADEGRFSSNASSEIDIMGASLADFEHAIVCSQDRQLRPVILPGAELLAGNPPETECPWTATTLAPGREGIVELFVLS